MKKRVFIVILCALLVANASACNNASSGNASGGGDTSSAVPAVSSPVVNESESSPTADAGEQIAEEGRIPCNGSQNDLMWYKINQSGVLTLCIDVWNEERVISSLTFADYTAIEKFVYAEKALAVNSQSAFLFIRQNGKTTVVKFEKGSQSESVTSLDNGESVIGIMANFINENIGYLFTFVEDPNSVHATGSAKLSSLFVTEDGGKTWNPTAPESFPSISLREYINFAKMASQDVGLVSGNFFGYDYNFCERTLITTDGGRNWVNVADLPQINELLWAIVTDFEQVGDSYLLKVRYTASEESGEYGYAEYKLNDLTTWTRVS